MNNLFDHSENSENDKMTREDKIQILVKIVPILCIVVILLIMLLVNHFNKQNAESPKEDVVSTEIILPSPEGKEETVSADEVGAQAFPSPTSIPSKDAETAATAAPDQPEDVFDYSNVEFDTQSQLEEMMAYWADGNQKALDDLAYLERFRAMSYQLKGTTDFYYAGEYNAQGQPHGVGIAVYADNQYYYGNWKNGLRDGEGRWMHYHIHASEKYNDLVLYHQYSGGFQNDLPDGEGQEHYDLNQELYEGNTRYYTNLIGSYKQGLFHGEFYIITESNNDDYEEWEGVAQDGSFVYCKDQKDQNGRQPVLTDVLDENNYIWMSDAENKKLGIQCYIYNR